MVISFHFHFIMATRSALNIMVLVCSAMAYQANCFPSSRLLSLPSCFSIIHLKELFQGFNKTFFHLYMNWKISNCRVGITIFSFTLKGQDWKNDKSRKVFLNYISMGDSSGFCFCKSSMSLSLKQISYVQTYYMQSVNKYTRMRY